MDEGWIGVDLDGTLAHDTGWHGPDQIGPPIPEMLERVRNWLNDGRRVSSGRKASSSGFLKIDEVPIS